MYWKSEITFPVTVWTLKSISLQASRCVTASNDTQTTQSKRVSFSVNTAQFASIKLLHVSTRPGVRQACKMYKRKLVVTRYNYCSVDPDVSLPQNWREIEWRQKFIIQYTYIGLNTNCSTVSSTKLHWMITIAITITLLTLFKLQSHFQLNQPTRWINFSSLLLVV
jgi:hypothetical protein